MGKDAVGSDDVLILYYDNLAPLAKCFEKYAADSEAEELRLSKDPVPDGSMNLQEFEKFAIDTGFFDPHILVQLSNHERRRHSIIGHRSSSVTQKDVRQIFSASQHDSDEPNEIEQKTVAADDNLSSHQELMIFSEFLEAVARLGVLKYMPRALEPHSESERVEVLSHCECIKLAVERVCSSCS